ncbi:anhydro-N-acetylmuramic acid kinase [Vibrio marisflavi]|uniref:Anhydro-N-acetylmuramic acid kinase n=1 Tax=Vibrio marisflavi CECT 7928 TaxID=634439 RepID=A0ABM9A718_9VIBR|nr:anhydro-N-acetylmuramic acid kinase [Vibrio marisflavi]CAH0541118.1 Anhydro-N-acetylmuramic acid kinase [Vibrio marisflavi CECT 7928]
MNNKELYVGVMSGTSLDGIDIALCEIDNHNAHLVNHHCYSMPKNIKQKVLDICLGQSTTLVDIGVLEHQLGHVYADAINEALIAFNVKARDIRAIGNHGQTVFHQPTGSTPFTIQLGDANIIASKTGIDTVADFRRKDIALGGQGAPLVPAFHRTIFNPTDSTVIVLNIGGIANISVLRPNSPVIGYDTGPGNVLMDIWCNEQQKGSYDHNAQFALSGNVHTDLLAGFLREDYFDRPNPKSTGRELFNQQWLSNKISDSAIRPEDIQRTLCELTAASICDEVKKFTEGPKPELLVCGGGAQNPLIMQRLQEILPSWLVQPTEEKGVNGEFMEAIAFAWLAQRRIHNLPSNLPEVTGANKQASLGVIYPAN